MKFMFMKDAGVLSLNIENLNADRNFKAEWIQCTLSLNFCQCPLSYQSGTVNLFMKKLTLTAKYFHFWKAFYINFNVDKKSKLVPGFCDGRFNCAD